MSKSTRDPRVAGPVPPFPAQQQEPPGEEARMRPRPDYGEKTYQGQGRLPERAVRASGGECVLMAGDLADEAHCRDLVAQTVSRYGRLDILVNNAAFQGKHVERFEDLSAERIERTFRVNIIAMFHLVRFAVPHMPEGGVVINVASVQAYDPSPSIIDYATTKGAIVTFTKALSEELIGRGIRVNAVAPGPVWTPLIPQSDTADGVKTFGRDAPMGRPAQPAELAPAFVFLASDDSRYITGEVLGVTGGRLLA